jgi:hypothetical protein
MERRKWVPEGERTNGQQWSNGSETDWNLLHYRAGMVFLVLPKASARAARPFMKAEDGNRVRPTVICPQLLGQLAVGGPVE